MHAWNDGFAICKEYKLNSIGIETTERYTAALELFEQRKSHNAGKMLYNKNVTPFWSF